MKIAFVFVVCGACETDPAREIEQCAHPGMHNDCCTSDESCIAFYGSDLPACVDGACQECGRNADCFDGATCIENVYGFGICAY